MSSTPAVLFAAIQVLTRAHSHNDYLQPRPLLDALANGFASVEADVFLVDGELRVGHDRQQLRPGRTLSSLYLDPLLKRVRANGGYVYPAPVGVTLLIDVKADPERVYARMREIFPRYAEMLTRYDGRVVPGAVTIILSGERPTATMRKEKRRFAFVDGRLPDLESDPPADLVPLVSSNFAETFGPTSGALPREKYYELRRLVELAHDQGRRIRFWATPEDPALWRQLYDTGVDLLNTDKLAELRAFLLTTRRP